MSYLSENVIPGKQGKVFGTNAKKEEDLERIIEVLRAIDGVQDIIMDKQKFPIEFTIHTFKMVKTTKIEGAIKALGFHIIPTGFFDF